MKRNERAEAAEVALRAHLLESDPEILAEIPEGSRNMDELTNLLI